MITEGTLLPLTAADIPIHTGWGTTVRSLPIRGKRNCRDCGYQLMCHQLERDDEPLPCEGMLDIEVAS